MQLATDGQQCGTRRQWTDKRQFGPERMVSRNFWSLRNIAAIRPHSFDIAVLPRHVVSPGPKPGDYNLFYSLGGELVALQLGAGWQRGPSLCHCSCSEKSRGMQTATRQHFQSRSPAPAESLPSSMQVMFRSLEPPSSCMHMLWCCCPQRCASAARASAVGGTRLPLRLGVRRI